MMKVSSKARIKSVALPVEHGGWAFLLEPLLLGFILAPSVAGLLLGGSAFGIFLLYQPLQITLKDYQRGKRYPRTVWAARFVFIYSAIAILCGLGVLMTANAPVWPAMVAIIAALPFACTQLILVLRGRTRSAVAEICGALALGVIAPAIVLLQGWSLSMALALWLIPMLRATASIVYVRTRLRLAHGHDANKVLPLALHSIGVLLMIFMVTIKLLPWGSILAMLMLLARAGYGLFSNRDNTPARVIGFQEIGFGLMTIALVILSYRV